MTRYLIAIVLLTGFSSCGIYRQNVVNTPLMQRKGQTQIGGHISFDKFDVQAAYAASNKIAAIANYSIVKRDDYNYFDKNSFGELGVGLYKKWKSGQTGELFFIVGKGVTEHTAFKPDTSGTLFSRKVNYSRYVLQADFGKSNRFEYILSPRLMGLHYYNFSDNIRDEYKYLPDFHIYAEGAFTLRYHIIQSLIISGQVSSTFVLLGAGGGYNNYYEFSPFNCSIGLIVNMNLFKSAKAN